MRRRRTSREVRDALLANVDWLYLWWGPYDPQGGSNQRGTFPAVAVRLLEPMWEACLVAYADGTATDRVRRLVEDPDTWAAAQYGKELR
jgi:hypothetical protein